MNFLLLSIALQIPVALPNGYEGFNWGMTVEQLTSQLPVKKATQGSEFGYADHMEQDPQVFVRTTQDNTRIEYYFFEDKLYKIFVVYDRAKSSNDFYKSLIKKTQKEHGNASSYYQENVMGIVVLHAIWDDGTSTLDLRSGAGYIYEVMINKAAERKKALAQQRKGSI